MSKKVLSVLILLLGMYILVLLALPIVKAERIVIVEPVVQRRLSDVVISEPIGAEKEQPHTRVEEFDTEEQIKEEIRLGDMEMLALLVHAEAGCEDLEGKRLVADVVLNRRDAGWADGTVEGVIFQTLGDVAQFSTTVDGAYDRAGWEITDSDFLAAQLEFEVEPERRLDNKIMYFRAGTWSNYGTRAYRHGGHYFSYE